MKFNVPPAGVIELALVCDKTGAVTSAIVTAIEIGDEVSVVWAFPAISAIENEPADESVEDVTPPPSTAVEIAAIVQTVEELWVMEEIEEMFPNVKSTPLVAERLEQSIGSFPETVNVSEVVLDVEEDRARVAMGAVASTETVIDPEVDAFPAVSVSVTVMIQSPSANVANVQAFEEIVHETLVAPLLEAVRTAVPENVPATVNVGVLSLVLLSEFEEPLSEPLCKSGVDGVGNVVELMTTPVSEDESLESTPLMRCFVVKVYV